MTNSEHNTRGWRELFRNFMRSYTGLTVIIVAAILLQGISAIQYYYTRSLLADELEKRAESEITTKAIIVKNALNMAENSLNGHIWYMKRNIAYPDSMYDIAERVLRSHPNLRGCGIAFRPGFYPEKGRLFEPYVFRKPGPRGEEELVRKQISGQGHDYTDMPFYKVTLNRNAPFWSYPYFNDPTDSRIVTYCRPIHGTDNSIVGVFGLDIDVSWLGDTLNYRHIYPSSYDFLLTETGQLIAGPKQKTKNDEMQHIIKLINDSTVEKSPSNSGRSTIFPFEDSNGDKGLTIYATFKGNPKWQIAVVCYDKEVYGKLRKMRFYIGLLMLAGLLMLGLIISRFAKNNRKLQKANMEKERIGSELRIATNIQKEMVPKTFPPYPERDDIDIFGMLVPAREVGGDLFDFFLRDEKLFFCIGDVSGKGVPSAIVMAVIHTMFRMASSHDSNPAHIMQTINEQSSEGNESNIFVTLFVGVLDLPTGRLRYCNAGHDVPVILGRGPLPAKANLPVGLFNDFTYEMQETTLDGGTTLFLYTDGLTEAKNIQHKMFGVQRVTDILNDSASLKPAALLEKMKCEVRAFVEDAEQSDDLTMLAIRYAPVVHKLLLDEQLTMRNNVHEVTRLSSFIKEITERIGIEKSLARQLRLAVEEAVVNVIDYAYPADTEGDILVKIMSDGTALRFQIIDSGIPFDPTAKEKADTTLSVEDRSIGGLGILLVRELMDTINYERSEGKNILTLIKRMTDGTH